MCDVAASPSAKPPRLRVEIPRVPVRAEMPEVMQSMPSDIDSEDERLIIPTTVSLPRKQRRPNTRSIRLSKNIKDTLLETLSNEGPPDKNAVTQQRYSVASGRTSPRARMSAENSGSAHRYMIYFFDMLLKLIG